jgi:hypothetical protein
VRRLAPAVALLAWVSLVEWKLLARLQSRPEDVSFVLTSVKGVLSGHPVTPSWQQRFVAPLLVSAVGLVTHDPLRALELFMGVMLLVANLLWFALVLRRGHDRFGATVAVACLVLAQLLIAYRLEYPWDAIDVVLFLLFGTLARGPLRKAVLPLLLVGTFNHETVLYLPLWYLLAPLDPDRSERARAVRFGLAAMVLTAGTIFGVRRLFYRGRPDLPAQFFEELTPVIDDPQHLRLNLERLFHTNFNDGRAWLSIGVLSLFALLTWTALRNPHGRRAAVWTLSVLATVLCFGYVNESRHYLPLVAFWFAYAWPAREVAKRGIDPMLSGR